MGPFERQIQELLNSPVSWEWVSCPSRYCSGAIDYCAIFDVEGLPYRVTFDGRSPMMRYWDGILAGMENERLWRINFDMQGEYSDTGTGNEATVLSTVIAIVKDWAAKYPPNFVYIKGSNHTRSDIYLKIFKRLFSSGWLVVFQGRSTLVIARESYLKKFDADDRDIAGLKKTRWADE